MIETVQQRQRGANDFSTYDDLCALQDSCPLPAVKAHLQEAILDINADRVRFQDWEPLLSALRINKTLQFVAFRSYFTMGGSEGMSEKRKAVLKQRLPAVRSKELSQRLSRALREMLQTSEAISCLELQGITLREKDLSQLVKGIPGNRTLTHLSLAFCRIGDVGVEILAKGLRQAGNVATLNLTSCALTSRGVEHLAQLIKHQSMCRHNEAWKDSLRYRRPNFDSMSGLRRLTLNCNPMLDDSGALLLAEALKDDLWVKAVDMQNCGVGGAGARSFLSVLKFNSTLVVVDLRGNPLVDRDLLHAVTEQVLVNGDGKESEYRWLRAEPLVQEVGPPAAEDSGRAARQKMKLRPLDKSRRPAFYPAGKSRPPRSRSAGGTPREQVQVQVQEDEWSSLEAADRQMGIPWRTAARACRYKGYPPDHTPGRNSVQEREEREERPLQLRLDPEEEGEIVCAPPVPATVKELKVELLQLRRRLEEECAARRRADRKVMDLLKNIERSFQQFHGFLDVLRDAGLAGVVSAAGLDRDFNDPIRRARAGAGAGAGAPTRREPEPKVRRGQIKAQSEPVPRRRRAPANKLSKLSPPAPAPAPVPVEDPVMSAVNVDPVEEGYLKASRAKSEADRLYERLKRATQTGRSAREEGVHLHLQQLDMPEYGELPLPGVRHPYQYQPQLITSTPAADQEPANTTFSLEQHQHHHHHQQVEQEQVQVERSVSEHLLSDKQELYASASFEDFSTATKNDAVADVEEEEEVEDAPSSSINIDD